MNLLITGGSGTIGNEITRQAYDKCDRIVIYSRGEAKQAEMKELFPEYPDNKMRYLIGDVRDPNRLTSAMRGIDHVIHAAAIKRVEVAEYDPCEAVKTNINGTMNVIEACNKANVKKCILTSTDKAACPETLYGATKLCGERLFISANNLGKCRFSVCRYANVEGSTGSVLKIWERQAAAGKPITITDSRMTRMWLSKEEAAAFILSKFEAMAGGEIFIPDLHGINIRKLAQTLYPDKPVEEIGLRPSERLYEVLITETDSRNCYYNGDYYVIYPAHHDWVKTISTTGTRVKEGFRLTSEETND